MDYFFVFKGAENRDILKSITDCQFQPYPLIYRAVSKIFIQIKSSRVFFFFGNRETR